MMSVIVGVLVYGVGYILNINKILL